MVLSGVTRAFGAVLGLVLLGCAGAARPSAPAVEAVAEPDSPAAGAVAAEPEPELGAVTAGTVTAIDAPAAHAAAPIAPSRGPAAADGAAVTRWIAERARRAGRGERERVRVPLVFASGGWGCRCPDHFVGSDSVAHNGGETWAQVTYEPGVTPPAPPRVAIGDGETMSDGMVLLVEGYFTGERVDVDLRDHGEPPEWLYHPWRLHVLRVIEPLDLERADAAHVEVIGALDGPACHLVVRDDRPPLRVRAAPSPRAQVVGGLDDGTRVAPVAWRGSWLRIDAPTAGWIWAPNARRACPR